MLEIPLFHKQPFKMPSPCLSRASEQSQRQSSHRSLIHRRHWNVSRHLRQPDSPSPPARTLRRPGRLAKSLQNTDMFTDSFSSAPLWICAHLKVTNYLLIANILKIED